MILGILLILCALFIVYVEGVQPFAIWNCVPVAIVYLIIRVALKKAEGVWRNMPLSRRMGLIGFSIFTLAFTLFLHFAWLFDLGQIATSSSTSALIFIFIPPYSLAAGGIGLFIGWLLGRGISYTIQR
ncbi:MAG: hypothetical protein P9M00_09860 [Candidatus Tritonobacter lacicola]|nr:hypothetical protein [Candidatus Tritonobacter lacicola]